MLGSLNKIIKSIFGDKSEKDIKLIQPLVEEINEIYEGFSLLSNDDLRGETNKLKSEIIEAYKDESDKISELKQQIENEPSLEPEDKEKIYEEIDSLEKQIDEKIEAKLNEILPRAFAIVKDTARRFKENEKLEVSISAVDERLVDIRDYIEISGDKAYWFNSWDAAGSEIVWDMVHYNVQLIGGTVLHQGKIAEMATGEGKTLVATLPIFLNALTGRGVHVVTVNDYLAKRDSEWNRPIFEFHGLTVDCIDKHQPNSEQRRQAYLADITYGTNNEFGFDYLRDNMASSPEDLVQRKHNYAIVDEVDSVLIDDARTPLIISGPTAKSDEHLYKQLKPRVEQLIEAQRKFVNQCLTDAKRLLNADEQNTPDKKQLAQMHKDGGLALLRAYRGMPKNKALIKFLSEPGMRGHLTKTENFYLQDQAKEMPFVDSELFFVIEEKQNSVELSDKGIDLITGNSDDPNFFVLPDIATEINKIEAEITDPKAALEKKDALVTEYSVKAERVHAISQLLKAYAMFENDVDYVVMENKVKIVDEQTGRIMEGRRYSDGLHQAIEAKENVKIEASSQTYATVTLQNYFRMYKKLSGMTGTAETEAGEFWEIYKLDVVVIPTNRPIARLDAQDLVYKTKKEKYNAVINEIEELTAKGRPVLVGTTSVEVSELLSRMLKMKKIKHNVLNAKLHQREAEVVAEAGKPGAVTIATNMAGRGTDIKLGAGVKESGGLAIIGTERHESRRVDRQLRGRAGRQGDPGSSQFFVSMEDNLMRIFGSERAVKWMDRMGYEEGEVIQHSMISKSIERAQTKVEQNNFGIRKRLLEYDDVMNSQREVIYKKRRHALYGERLGVDIANSVYELCEEITNDNHPARDFGSFEMSVFSSLMPQIPFTENQFLETSTEEVTQKLYEKARDFYKQKSETIAQTALPVIQSVHEDPNASFKNILIPFTDGKKTLQVSADLEKCYQTKGVEVVRALERGVVLAMIDQTWKDHLREMDDLRQSVQGAVYEQKDPLLIYKFESFELFKSMLSKVNAEIVPFLMKANLPMRENTKVAEAKELPKSNANVTAGREDVLPGALGQQAYDPSANQQPKKKQPIVVGDKIGRNDKVEIRSTVTGESQTLKYKQAMPLINKGEWELVDRV